MASSTTAIATRVIRRRRRGEATPRCLARFSGDGAETLGRFTSTARAAERLLDGAALRFAGATCERPAAPRIDVAVPRTGVCDEDRRGGSARRAFVELAVRLELLLGVERWAVVRAERLAARSCGAATSLRPGFRPGVRGECERVAMVVS
tara:strand:- start:316 stop:765 length:450 start_codon:yes stop_codon:yes gene_type:complete